MTADLTIVYITANKLREPFAAYVREVLWDAKGDLPLISVSKQPLAYGDNLVFDTPAGLWAEYWETYQGVQAAQTPYVAIAEDDTLYAPDHFRLRPAAGSFSFNLCCWQIYTWVHPPLYSYKGRRNHNGLICERDLYLREMAERFARYPEPASIDSRAIHYFAEPGRYERQLGITVYPAVDLITYTPNVRFCHEDDCLGWRTQGKRKKLGFLRAFDIPYWGPATHLLARYHGG